MERVLSQSWRWVRNWVPPGLTAMALAASLVGLWGLMLETNPVADASTRTPSAAPRVASSVSEPYRQATSRSVAPPTAPESVATPGESDLATAATATECQALQKEIDSVSVRIRGSAKSRQTNRSRARLRELKKVYEEECAHPISAQAN